MKKLVLVAAALAAAPSLAFTAPVLADSPGSLASGPDLYQVRNVTKNGGYASSASATCGDVVKYSIKLANSEYGLLTNVTVKAPLSGAMTATATNAANQQTSVSGNVTVNVEKGKLAYVAGSTQNLDVNGGLIKTLPDGITTSGVNKGNLNGSTREFVQFQAKVVCETQPTPETPVTPVTPTNPEKPQTLGTAAPAVIAATGPASTIATMTGLSALAAGIGYFAQRRRNLLG